VICDGGKARAQQFSSVPIHDQDAEHSGVVSLHDRHIAEILIAESAPNLALQRVFEPKTERLP
jgi:hypothetical protein